MKQIALLGALAAIAVGGLRPASAADAETIRRIDELFAEWDRTSSPGCAIAVYRDGRLDYARGYGMADLERGVPITPRSVFDIASTSKQFVAMCILLLEEQGRLSLDDDIRAHIPQMPDYGTPITIRHLVHHTSGIRDYLTLMAIAGLPMEHDYPEAQIVDLLSRQRSLNFEPGTEHLYSNSGYFLLGEIVHRVTGQPLGAFARDAIFEPLGMRATEFYDDYNRIVPNRAIGYMPRDGGGFETELYLFDLVGDGGVLTSVEDLCLWDRNFYDNRLGAATPALIERMLSPGRLADGEALEYAGGLIVSSYRGLPTVAHGGDWAGYRSQLLRFPAQRVSVVVLSNLGSVDPDGLARKVADIVLAGELAPRPAPDEVAAPPGDVDPDAPTDADAERWVGVYRHRERGTLWRVTIAGDALQLTAGPRTYALAPMDPGRYRLVEAPVEVQLTFEPDGHGGIALRADIEGEGVRTYDRVEIVRPSDEALRSLAGTYRSDELDAVYELSFDDGALQAATPYGRPTALEPTVQDEFRLGGYLVRIRRDDAGTPAGFEVQAGRVRGVVFERID